MNQPNEPTSPTDPPNPSPMLFSREHLAALTGAESLPEELYAAVHGWVLAEIQGEVGERLTDPPQSAVVAVALELARPAALNPGNVSSKSVGPLQVTFARSTDVREDTLDRKQRMRLRKACGIPSTFSVSTAAPSDKESP